MTATLIWFEDFESYPPGNNTITAPWVNTGPLGPSFPDSQISIAYSHSPTQSLGVAINGGSAEGSGWVQRSIKNGASDLGPAWTVDIWVYMPSGTTVPDPPESNAPGFQLQQTGTGGYVSFRMGGLGSCTISAGTSPPWNTLRPHTRYVAPFDLEGHDGCFGTSALSIDGAGPLNFSGDTRTNSGDTTVNLFQVQGQFVDGDPPIEFLVDDISIYDGIYTPVAPPVFVGCGAHTSTSISPIWSNTSDAPYTVQYRIDGTSTWTQIDDIAAPYVHHHWAASWAGNMSGR